MSDSEFLCARCARHMRTCCQTCEIYATPGDVRRIEQHTGLSEFVEFRPPANPAYLDQSDDPAWERSVFRPDHTRRVLKRQASGDCTFLGSQGCVLPLDVRPLVCRLYPFDYNASGLLTELSPGCPLELLQPGLTLLDELRMEPGDAQQWHRQLYAEIREEPHAQPLPTSTPGPESNTIAPVTPCTSV